jgi:hypothetical protein
MHLPSDFCSAGEKDVFDRHPEVIDCSLSQDLNAGKQAQATYALL